ncbi:Mitochondrial fission protein [Microbotryomycetes sp. JL221]|nr:Mitochondrial fission protein [Microbotryomycetes sp. JL221]
MPRSRQTSSSPDDDITQDQQQQQQQSDQQQSTSRFGSWKQMLTPTPASTLLADLAPQLLHPNIVNSSHFSPSSSSSNRRVGSNKTTSSNSSASLRTRLALGWQVATSPSVGGLLQDSNSLYIRERVDDLLTLEVPPAPFEFTSSATTSTTTATNNNQSSRPLITANGEFVAPDSQVPLIRGFTATIPNAKLAKLDRRRKRAGLGEQVLGLEQGTKLGLRQRGDVARGLLTDGDDGGETFNQSLSSSSSPSSLGINARASVGPKRRRKSGRRSELFTTMRTMPARDGNKQGALQAVDEDEREVNDLPEQSLTEMETDVRAVEVDMSNVAVRRALLNSQVADVDVKIAALDAVRQSLRQDLLSLREEELELEDELEGLRERITIKTETLQGRAVSTSLSSRRRKGPAFLPSEHDDLPNNVAFMTLAGHLAPITAIDFSEPYGTAVTASHDQSVRLWDLTNGQEIGYLKGHKGAVKVLQVESSLCVTGGSDGQIRIWDLDVAETLFPSTVNGGGSSVNSNFIHSPSDVLDRVTRSMENVFLGTTESNKSVVDDVFTTRPGDVGVGGAGLVNGNGILSEDQHDDGLMRESKDATTLNDESQNGACVKKLDGHSRAVTSLYFDGSCLVTGSNDSTLRQWDLTTGQCVLTMDILWAISNASQSFTTTTEEDYGFNNHSSSSSSHSNMYSSLGHGSTPHVSPRKSFGAMRRQSSSSFGVGPLSPGASAGDGLGIGASPTTTTYADGSWELYDDFVGGVQFWGYALASGTADGCVRMWDMRTGQAHRTLVGHTGPVTCLQFDEMHLISGSLDKSIRIWDLRTGSISDTIRYDHPITSLQFDTRKIVAAAGENGVRVFNRTTLQHTSLTNNGHTSPAERLRFMDSYLCSGGRDNTVKVWRL